MYMLIAEGGELIDLFQIKEEALFWHIILNLQGIKTKIKTVSWKIAG
jgi:hypothetical protein